MRSLARWLCLFAACAVAGCAGTAPRLADLSATSLPSRVALDETPFFPQAEYQCGPAALATVLAASGVATTPDQLVSAVYIPGRKGSLQPEIVAATRAHGRLAYLNPADPDALLAAVAAGHPVLVLQKLGAGPWPGWHYAVLVGYDLDTNRVTLRSGTTRAREMSAAKFLWSWDRAGRWSLLALAPGELPPRADAARYLEAAAGLEATGRAGDAELAYRAAAQQWPDAAMPRLGLGNLAYARGDYAAAATEYFAATRRDATDPVAFNNLAETLVRLGCPQKARATIETAVRLAGTGPLAATVGASAREMAQQTTRDAAPCVAW